MYFYNMETHKIWQQYSDELRGYLTAKTGDRELTDDILQEVFLKVHLKSSQLRSAGKLRSWLYSIAGNTLNDIYRKKGYPILDNPVEEEEVKEDHSAENCLMPLIKELPEKYKQALLLSEIQELKQHQVAEILGISVSGAKSRIQRGRKLLQEGYMKCCNYALNEDGLLVGENKSEEECKVCK